MGKLKVVFSEPEHGWITLSIADDEQSVSIDADSKRESFAELINALIGCLDAKGEFSVTWLEEPNIKELHFQKRNDGITLRVFDSDVSSYNKIYAKPILTVTDSYTQICLPFWRALRSLQGRYSLRELEKRIQDNFPTKLLSDLTTRIEIYKLQQEKID